MPGKAKTRPLRVVLLHAPRWKIPAPGTPIAEADGGPPSWAPANFEDDPNSSDYITAPYGLMSLASQAKRAGHEVFIFNVGNFKWPDIERLIRRLEADVYGTTLYHSNFRGVGCLAELVKSVYPEAMFVVGGPQATALPAETLRHLAAIDMVVVGEGEATLLELLDRVKRGEPVTGLAGTAWRDGEMVRFGPLRPLIKDLDTLAAPHLDFRSNIFMTSRGCPMKCTFCGSGTVWGRNVRAHSAEYVLEALSHCVNTIKATFVMVKDDTFTVNRRRVLAICNGIRERGLNFLWSCDTRADCLDEEILKAMRMAGCQRISLGVESASPTILKAMKKGVTPEVVLNATRLAQKYGIRCRFFMIYGGPDETLETLEESVQFIRLARPSEAIFSFYTVYPGTEDFRLAQEKFGLDGDVFFKQSVGILFQPDDAKINQFNDWYRRHAPEWELTYYNAEECRAVLARLPDLGAAHADLAAALIREGQYAEAASSLAEARRLNYPRPGLLDNMAAALAFVNGDAEQALALFERAYAHYPHANVTHNLNVLRQWLAGGRAAGAAVAFQIDTELDSWLFYEQPGQPGEIRLNDLPPQLTLA